jgi:hypothetical protein
MKYLYFLIFLFSLHPLVASADSTSVVVLTPAEKVKAQNWNGAGISQFIPKVGLFSRGMDKQMQSAFSAANASSLTLVIEAEPATPKIEATYEVAKNEKILERDLVAALRVAAQGKKYTRIVGLHGSPFLVHRLSDQVEGSCSASFLAEGAGPARDHEFADTYSKRMARILKHRGIVDENHGINPEKMNLLDAHYFSAFADSFNSGMGELSSLRFARRALSAKGNSAPIPRPNDVLEYFENLKLFTVNRVDIPKEAQNCAEGALQEMPLLGLIESIQDRLKKPTASLPPALRQMEERYAKIFLPSLKKDKQTIKELAEQHKLLVEKLEKARSARKSERTPTDDEFVVIDEMRRMETATQLLGTMYWNLYSMYMQHDQVRRFLETASAQEKEKYAKLLDCEIVPIYLSR